LKQSGHEVIGVDRNTESDLPIDYLDVSLRKSCDSILSKHQGVDSIVHCAAIVHAKEGIFSSEQYYLTNAQGTKNILDAAIAHGVKRFIQISTVSVYGEFDLPVPVSENSPTNPNGYYGISKKKAEDFCLERKNDICLYVLRMTTMYGQKWLFNIRKKVTPPVISRYSYLTLNGKSDRYSLCSDRNGAEAVLWAIEGRLDAGTYNIADYFNYSLYDILRAVEKAEGKKWHICIPKIISSLILKSLILFSITPAQRLNAYSRHWAFFESNLFSIDKLKSTGFNSQPHLLDMAK